MKYNTFISKVYFKSFESFVLWAGNHGNKYDGFFIRKYNLNRSLLVDLFIK